MEREQIIREDFPSARRGWDPDAVRAHLESVAERILTGPPTLAEDAGARVSSILAAAEDTARQIEEQARSEADQLLEKARTEAGEQLERARVASEQMLAAARGEASESVEGAQRAVQGLISQAEELRGKVGALGDSLAGEPETAAAAPEPAVEAEPEGEPEPKPEPTPKPEPAPDPVAGAGPREESEPATAAGADASAARLIAMSKALDGAGREQIAAELESQFGAVDGIDELLDDVLARADR